MASGISPNDMPYRAKKKKKKKLLFFRLKISFTTAPPIFPHRVMLWQCKFIEHYEMGSESSCLTLLLSL